MKKVENKTESILEAMNQDLIERQRGAKLTVFNTVENTYEIHDLKTNANTARYVANEQVQEAFALIDYPDQVLQILKQASNAVEGYKIPFSHQYTYYLKPILDLQLILIRAGEPSYMQYALQATIDKGVAGETEVVGNTKVVRPKIGWHKYLRGIINNRASNSVAILEAKPKSKVHRGAYNEDTMNEALENVRELFISGEIAQAKKEIARLLKHAHDIADLFEGDISQAKIAILKSAKYGQHDIIDCYKRENAKGYVRDFLPDARVKGGESHGL